MCWFIKVDKLNIRNPYEITRISSKYNKQILPFLNIIKFRTGSTYAICCIFIYICNCMVPTKEIRYKGSMQLINKFNLHISIHYLKPIWKSSIFRSINNLIWRIFKSVIYNQYINRDSKLMVLWINVNNL